MKNYKKIGLGTVQFGLDYGISNNSGKLNDKEVLKILDYAKKIDLCFLDTAPTYGNSEERIGQFLPMHHDFSIVSKTPVFHSPPLTQNEKGKILKSVKESILKLKQDKIYGLLIHHASMFFYEGAEHIVEALEESKRLGIVKKVGVSAHSEAELHKILEFMTPDIVQIPYNILNQTLAQSGMIEELKSKGVEIHIRSLFLQGLLLMDLNEIPTYFTPIQSTLRELRAFLKENDLSPLEACILFGYQTDEIDALIVGINNVEHLKEIIKSVDRVTDRNLDFSQFAISDDNFLNPAKWARA